MSYKSSYMEQEILKRYPVLDQVKRYLRKVDLCRVWVMIYASIAAKEKDADVLLTASLKEANSPVQQ